MANENTTTDEIMDFLQDNMVVKGEFNEFREEVNERFEKVGRDMRTQKLEILDAIDDKLAYLKGDLVIMMRKEDKKVTELIRVLAQKDMLSPEETARLLEIQPFPQSSV